MNDTVTLTPVLSSGFNRARKLSRFMAVFFTLAFLLMLFVLVASLIAAIFRFPNFGVGLGHGIRIPTGDLRGPQAVMALVAATLVLVPIVLILHHARKLFFCFARGEVFATQPIAHIRAAGLWMTLSFFTGIAAVYLLQLSGLKNAFFPVSLRFLPALTLEFKGALLTGIPIVIAAYVMEEARRIAADHAEII